MILLLLSCRLSLAILALLRNSHFLRVFQGVQLYSSPLAQPWIDLVRMAAELALAESSVVLAGADISQLDFGRGIKDLDRRKL